MSPYSEENAVAGGQLSSLAAAELSSADLSGVSPTKQLDTCLAGREVVFVCTYGPISLKL